MSGAGLALLLHDDKHFRVSRSHPYPSFRVDGSATPDTTAAAAATAAAVTAATDAGGEENGAGAKGGKDGGDRRESGTEVLIGIEAIGLNPIDWKCNAYGFGVYHYPWLAGREASGVVLAVSPHDRSDAAPRSIGERSNDTDGDDRDDDDGGNTAHSGLRIGDRVTVTSTNYRDNRTSTFQERVMALAENCIRLPAHVSTAEGASLGVAFVAAHACLSGGMGLDLDPPPRRTQAASSAASGASEGGEKEWILIWGGATVTGYIAAQLAKHAGLGVVAVSSVRNFAALRGIGVDVTLDRGNADEVVRVARDLKVRYVLDCVGDKTGLHGIRALSADDSHLEEPYDRRSTPQHVFVPLVQAPKLRALSSLTAEQRAASASSSAQIDDEGKPLPPVYDDARIRIGECVVKRFHESPLSYGAKVVALAERLLAAGIVRPSPVRHVGGGFEGLQRAMDIMQRGEVSCEKLVVEVRDTPDHRIPVYPSAAKAVEGTEGNLRRYSLPTPEYTPAQALTARDRQDSLEQHLVALGHAISAVAVP